MSQLTLCILLLLVVHSAVLATLSVVSIPGNETCLPQEKREEAIQNIRIYVQTVIQDNNIMNIKCGAGQWYRVAQLNMSNSSQQCPSAWREYNSISGIKACGRLDTWSHNCAATFYATSHQYSRVCGRVIGYQYSATEAFGLFSVGQTIDSYYVSGVSVTHGTPRNHIWTLAAGFAESNHPRIHPTSICPCYNLTNPQNAPPPPFVGNNYYCESGNKMNYAQSHVYTDDPLWDGQQCEGQCCSNGKSPPWFSVELLDSTTDDIEVRICGLRGTVAIQLLELYVSEEE